MAQDTAVEVSHVSKKFAKDLGCLMKYGFMDISKNILGLNTHSEKLRKGEFWAVNDVSFKLKRGETLGIIGPNGSGKTTILKMLNGILALDKGEIKVKGKVGALIEIGAGFHPLLTGRENIYVNGSILGMSKKEIDKKFDKIIEFAEIGDFLDAPVRTYSSGMFVRLGFSVAAHCEPDILLIDEVLAVGDLAFALKCHRKMSEFRQGGGTVVMVSQNMQAIRNMCKKALWLDGGKVKEIGEVHNVCDSYEAEIIVDEKNGAQTRGHRLHYDPKVEIAKVEFLNRSNRRCVNYKIGDSLKLRIHFSCQRMVKQPIFAVSIFNSEGLLVSSNYSHFDGYNITQIFGIGYIDFFLSKLAFKPSKYICTVSLSEKEVSNVLDVHRKSYLFTVTGNSTNYGFVNPFPKWYLKGEI